LSWLSFAELDRRSDEIDDLAGRTPDIDAFCSSSAWVLPAQAAFAPNARPLIHESADGVAAFMSLALEGGVVAAVPLEASWGLASGLLGADPEPVVAGFLAALRAEPSTERPRVIAFSGTDPDSRAAEVLDRAGARPAGMATDRIVASLEGGLEGFLGRRSAKFRAEARRARRAAEASGIVYEHHLAFADGALGRAEERILAIERKSWKSAEGNGIDAGPMREFYRRMLPRLAKKGSLRLVFVSRGGADVAFCFGGLGGGIYRGLQASFDHAQAKDSPGVLAHLEMIRLLADEGALGYDLGTDMEYKRRWGEPGLRTVAYVLAV
jgi:Acetyltransferase (GNAT) domain